MPNHIAIALGCTLLLVSITGVHWSPVESWYIPVYSAGMTILERICAALEHGSVRYAIVGGYAVALHGAVRGTVDIDVAIAWNRKTLLATEAALKGAGLVSRLPVTAADVFAYRDEFVANRNLIAWNFYNPDNLAEQVDVIITYDLRGKRTRRLRVGETQVRILSLNDLIEMKRQSARPQDLEDIAALEKLR
jgi:hypothetical protein